MTFNYRFTSISSGNKISCYRTSALNPSLKKILFKKKLKPHFLNCIEITKVLYKSVVFCLNIHYVFLNIFK